EVSTSEFTPRIGGRNRQPVLPQVDGVLLDGPLVAGPGRLDRPGGVAPLGGPADVDGAVGHPPALRASPLDAPGGRRCMPGHGRCSWSWSSQETQAAPTVSWWGLSHPQVQTTV